MWFTKKEDRENMQKGNLFVKDLESTVDQKELSDLFSRCGNVDSCKVELFNDGTSRGYGFVHFEKEEDAKRAIDELDGFELKGKKIVVTEHKRRSEREPADIQFNNLYVKNIPASFKQDEITKLFDQFGSVNSMKFPRANDSDPNSDAKGYGFVCFAEPEHAKTAIDELNGLEVAPGFKLELSRHLSKREREEQVAQSYKKEKQERNNKFADCNFHVKPLPLDLTDEELQAKFATFGTVLSAKIPRTNKTNEKGENIQEGRGFGFVCFEDPNQARKAFIELNGTTQWGKKVSIEYFEPKEERQEKKQKERINNMMGNMQTMMPQFFMNMAQFMMPPMGADPNAMRGGFGGMPNQFNPGFQGQY